MAYSLFSAPATSSPACPPIKFICDGNCPFIILHCGQGQKDLCDRIIGASRLADKAAAARNFRGRHGDRRRRATWWRRGSGQWLPSCEHATHFIDAPKTSVEDRDRVLSRRIPLTLS